MENYDGKLGVAVKLETPDHFLLCKESLTRIGVANIKDKVLYQSVHILHKRGFYYICSFKRLFELDGKPSTLTADDVARENTIAKLLEQWKLLKIIYPEMLTEFAPLNSIKILSYGDKKNWTLKQKYSLGGSNNG